MNLVIVSGSTRTNRKSLLAARIIEQQAAEFPQLTTQFIDTAQYFPLPGEGNDPESKNRDWVEINKWADAYFIVIPEYNHGYPGSLKMLLDNDLGNYTHKPVALAGVSSGAIGGARAIENILPVLRTLGMVACNTDVHFPFSEELFNPDGTLADPNSTIPARISKVYKELIWMGKTLKWGRDNLT